MDKKKQYFPIYPDLWDNQAMFVMALEWKVEVYDQAKLVDPNNESKWGDLAMGYALGKGLSPDQACDFELFVSHLKIS